MDNNLFILFLCLAAAVVIVFMCSKKHESFENGCSQPKPHCEPGLGGTGRAVCDDGRWICETR